MPDGTLDERTLRELDARLAKVGGQVRGIRGMILEDRKPVDIVTQVAAVHAALKQVETILVAFEVEGWLGRSRDPLVRNSDLRHLRALLDQHRR